MSAERFALDTNVLAYTRDNAHPERQIRARVVVDRSARSGRCTLSAQVVGELHAALGKRGVVAPVARVQAVRDLVGLFPLAGILPRDAEQALDAADGGRFSYWDALLLSTVGRAGCSALLSEDMQHGAELAGVTVRNPFAGDKLPEDVDALLG